MVHPEPLYVGDEGQGYIGQCSRSQDEKKRLIFSAMDTYTRGETNQLWRKADLNLKLNLRMVIYRVLRAKVVGATASESLLVTLETDKFIFGSHSSEQITDVSEQ